MYIGHRVQVYKVTHARIFGKNRERSLIWCKSGLDKCLAFVCYRHLNLTIFRGFKLDLALTAFSHEERRSTESLQHAIKQSVEVTSCVWLIIKAVNKVLLHSHILDQE